jgi:putative membrane protein insertion efficiency factor
MSEKLYHRRSVVQLALLGSIGAYRRVVSPLLPRSCRFYPSCSAYASEAVATHGALRGMALAAARLLRCHPWCEGGVDPVPSRERCAHDLHHATRVMKGRA